MTPSASSSSAASRGPTSPWWRHGMVWLVLAGPVLVVLAGVATLLIAVAHPDPALPVSTSTAPTQQAAMQARNHAAAPR